ncbi:hypothetical protein BC962_2028 [Gillisia mitskevichiae]|uniref:Uncharacterized protein n=1 Tax=Gillisia mitskevichiae TaxID=270921 RepID=A0A495PW48_9FLAO|nr:hypothetical protein [Gillisia mitskevichiae]RKS53772.1 hypothetical protein BC962_2028 [Gillisia mitskevichiae]
MKTITRYLAFMVLLSPLFSSCSKEEEEVAVNIESFTQSISLEFGAVLNDLSNKMISKENFSQIPDCVNDAAPAVARLSISFNGETKTMDIDILTNGTNYYTDYSDELKIPVVVSDDGNNENDYTTVTLSKFLIYDGDPDGAGNLIWVAPTGDGDFLGYVDKPLPLDIIVRPGTKKNEVIEVFCFDQQIVNEYGYSFLELMPQKLYKLCFFANYCHSDGRHYPGNYSLDLFVQDANGIRVQLYNNEDTNAKPITGQYENGEYFSQLLCLVIPGPPEKVENDQDYLFYTITPENSDAYGDIDNTALAEEGLSWNDINVLFNDNNTMEYIHIFINCDTPSDCGEFVAIPESSFYNEIIPKDPVDYFEIVNYLDEILFSFSQGELCADAVDMVACINEFNNLIAEEGFYISCLPAGCYTFIRHQTDGVNQLVSTDEELLDFLGSIDSKGDALLLALSNDYYWSTNNMENGAIKEACTGYELIVNKIVSYCTPLQIDRFHLSITPSAEIIILDQEVIEFEENLCI